MARDGGRRGELLTVVPGPCVIQARAGVMAERLHAICAHAQAEECNGEPPFGLPVWPLRSWGRTSPVLSDNRPLRLHAVSLLTAFWAAAPPSEKKINALFLLCTSNRGLCMRRAENVLRLLCQTPFESDVVGGVGSVK